MHCVHVISCSIYTTLYEAVLCRSVYFGAYAHCKSMYHDLIRPVTKVEQSIVHLCSAASAGNFFVRLESLQLFQLALCCLLIICGLHLYSYCYECEISDGAAAKCALHEFLCGPQALRQRVIICGSQTPDVDVVVYECRPRPLCPSPVTLHHSSNVNIT